MSTIYCPEKSVALTFESVNKILKSDQSDKAVEQYYSVRDCLTIKNQIKQFVILCIFIISFWGQKVQHRRN